MVAPITRRSPRRMGNIITTLVLLPSVVRHALHAEVHVARLAGVRGDVLYPEHLAIDAHPLPDALADAMGATEIELHGARPLGPGGQGRVRLVGRIELQV